MKPQVFCAGLFHETHSFLEERTRVEDFRACGFGGSESLALPGSPMAGAIRIFSDAGFGVREGPYWLAMPSGTVTDDVLVAWKKLFREAWEQRGDGVEGIYLVLHGAMCSESEDDVETQIVEWVRSLPGAGELPVFAVLDLHGNISPAFCHAIDGCLAYRENPHIDAVEAAERSASLLVRTVREPLSVKTRWRGLGFIWPPSGTGTAEAPMSLLEAKARQIEEASGVLAVNVFAGYSYSDTDCCGPSFTLTAEKSVADEAIDIWFDELCHIGCEHRDAGYPAADSMEAVAELAQSGTDRPILVAEPSDNIGAGAPGDTTGLLRLFIEYGLNGAGVILNDPAAVRSLGGIKPGDLCRLPIGGRGSRLDVGPLELDWELLRCFSGKFELEDPRSHLASMVGTSIDMGDCALVRHKGVTVLLTSLKTPPFDLGQWRVAGVNPEDFKIIGVKAAVAYRRAYDPIASAHFIIDTPGPCQLDLKTLPFRRVRRPIYPLDDF